MLDMGLGDDAGLHSVNGKGNGNYYLCRTVILPLPIVVKNRGLVCIRSLRDVIGSKCM